MRCLYLKYILHEDEERLLKSFFNIQLEHCLKEDWVYMYTCLADLKEMEIKESFEEIKQMSQNKCSYLLFKSLTKNALHYLKDKQRRNGRVPSAICTDNFACSM